MIRGYKHPVRIVAAVLALVGLLVSVVVVRASQGGPTRDSFTYAGTLSGVASGTYPFSFVFHRGGVDCSVAKSASVAASGAFAVTFSSSDASCLTGYFDGSDVTVT